MKQDRDWLKTVGERLRDAETPLPKGGWERLAGELPAAAPHKPLWVRRWPKYAAAAAVVLICFAAGDAYWRASRQVGTEIPEIAALLPDAGVELSKSSEMSAVAEAMPVVSQAKPGKGVPDVGRIQTDTEVYEFDYQVNTAEKSRVAESGSPDAASAAEGQTIAAPFGAENTHTQPSRSQSVRQRSVVAAADPFAEPLSKQQGGGVLFGAKAGGTLTSGGKQNGVLPRALASAMMGGENPMDPTTGGGMIVPLRINFAECTYAHKQPLSFAFTVGKAFPYGLSLESGISYTLLRSKVTMPYASSEVAQSLQMLGIPVRLNWSWLNRGGFSLYLSGGGLAEKCISARFDGEKIQEKAVQFSVFGALGAQYKLGKHVGLYFEPEVSYYFTETTLRTSRTDSPVSVTLQLGVRFSY